MVIDQKILSNGQNFFESEPKFVENANESYTENMVTISLTGQN